MSRQKGLGRLFALRHLSSRSCIDFGDIRTRASATKVKGRDLEHAWSLTNQRAKGENTRFLSGDKD